MKVRLLWIVAICLAAVSCRTAQQVVVKKELPLMTENRLLKHIEENQLEYNTLFAKRIDGSFKSEEGGDTFKASLKIQRDSFIQVAVTGPMGIEVARILLTKDSVKFADPYHKKYFLTDYGFFYEQFETELDFDYIQGILTNRLVNVDFTNVMGAKHYRVSRTEDGFYELSRIEEKTLGRKLKRLYKKKRKNKEVMLIQQKVLVDARHFRPASFTIEDVEEDMGVRVKYEELKDFEGFLFPGRMLLEFFTERGGTLVNLKFQKVEFNVPVKPNFRISSKYKKIENVEW